MESQGIVVSDYGSLLTKGMAPAIEVLPSIVDAIGGRVPVLVDGSFRRGSDIFKALAFGATAVMIGRPAMWGLAAYGADGVQSVVEMLQTEVGRDLGHCGTPTIKAIYSDPRENSSGVDVDSVCDLIVWATAASSSLLMQFDSVARFLPQRTVHQFFDELHTLEFHEPGIFLRMPVEWHTDLPRPGKFFGVFDGRFVVHDDSPPRVCSVQRHAMRRCGNPRPGQTSCLLVNRYVDYQRVSFPMADRLPHPRVDRGWTRIL